VPFLGIRGIVLKAHGSSTARAIANAILTAMTTVRKNVLADTMISDVKGIQ
jgi:fatty acid/phospholipid biosynthesis enzyme